MEWSWSLNKKLLVVRVESDAEVCGVTNAHRNCGNQKNGTIVFDILASPVKNIKKII